MRQTTNYHFLKPDYSDPADVKDLNDNMDLIDSALVLKANLVGGKVPASELPSYVDDVVEGYYYNGAFYKDSAHTTPITGEAGKIYVDLTTDESYRWSGSAYVLIATPNPPVTDVQNEAGQSFVHNGVAVIPDPALNVAIIDIDDNFTTALTTGEIKALIEAGKAPIVRFIDDVNSTTTFLFVTYLYFDEFNSSMNIYGDPFYDGTIQIWTLSSSSYDDPFAI